MSGNHSDGSSSNRSPFRTADEIVRSILDDSASPSEISPSGELYRAIERFHSHHTSSSTARRELTRNHLSRWVSRTSSRNGMPSESNSEAPRRRFSRDPQSSDASPLYNLPPSAPSLPPLRSSTTRRSAANPGSNESVGVQSRPRASDRFWLERHRVVPEDWSDLSDEPSELWNQHRPLLDHLRDRRRAAMAQSERDLEGLESDSRSLWDFSTVPSNPFSELSFSSPPLQSQDPPEESRRTKRRKLDSDRLITGFSGFRYGKYGQVEPGQLTMEIVSCDGGIYADDGQKHAAENILKNDASVYCTSGPRCNIVLRHQGATVFTLKELVIKAPRSNYTSP
jgi:hypothetical protein